ncbi:MAG TPA: hypothetical protein DD671_04870, partial [Balneolaceae bacterium]|nr:hypothetical protein [Balneolaceae bacterium]
MRDLIEKYRLLVSIGLGLLITILVLLLWLNYQQTLKKNQVNKITETAQLLTGQFQEVVQNNIQTLENFGDRLENTNGAFFDYWDSEADQIVEQDSSFLFLEWIDRSMVIRRVNPAEENQEAVGLDISELDYP